MASAISRVWTPSSSSSATACSRLPAGPSRTPSERAAGGPLYVGSTSATDLSGVVVPLTLKVVDPREISSFKTSLNQL